MTRRDRRRCPRLGRARGDAPPATARAPRLLPAGSGSAAAAEAPEGAAPGSDDRVRRLGLVASARPRRQACAAWGNLGLGRRGPGRNPYRGGTPMWSEPGSGGNLDLVGTRTGKEPGSGGNSELGGPCTWEEHRPGRNADLGGRGAPVGLGSDRLSSRTTQCLGGFWKNGEMSALSLDVHPECFTSSSPGPVCWKEPKILTESHESRLLNPGRKKQGQAGDRARRPTRVPEGLAGARSGSTAKGTAFPGLAVPNRFLTQSLHLRVSSCSRMVQGRSTFFVFVFVFCLVGSPTKRHTPSSFCSLCPRTRSIWPATDRPGRPAQPPGRR